MSELSSNQMQVVIFNKKYRVACPDGLEDKLVEAADFLNRRAREMKESNASLSAELTTTITALNLAHELLEQRREKGTRKDLGSEIHARLQVIKNRLDADPLRQKSKSGQLHQF